MLDRQIMFDNDSNIIRCKLRRADNGQGITGLTSASAGLIISTICDNEASATTYTQAGGTIETIATLGTYAAPTATKCRFKEVDATNHPGTYEFQFADARFAVASATTMRISVLGATNLLEREILVELVRYNPQDSVRMGMTALPNAAADGVGGLPISDAGGLDLDTKLANTNEVTADRMGALTDWINGGRLDLLLDGVISTIGIDGAGLTALGDARLGNLDAAVSTVSTLTADDVLDEVCEGGITLRQVMMAILAYIAGRANGGGTATVNFRNQANTKNRISLTVDASGNRSATALDFS